MATRRRRARPGHHLTHRRWRSPDRRRRLSRPRQGSGEQAGAPAESPDQPCRFYAARITAILTPEWMRIFIWAGPAGAALNRRRQKQAGQDHLRPLWAEVPGPWG